MNRAELASTYRSQILMIRAWAELRRARLIDTPMDRRMWDDVSPFRLQMSRTLLFFVFLVRPYLYSLVAKTAQLIWLLWLWYKHLNVSYWYIIGVPISPSLYTTQSGWVMDKYPLHPVHSTPSDREGGLFAWGPWPSVRWHTLYHNTEDMAPSLSRVKPGFTHLS